MSIEQQRNKVFRILQAKVQRLSTLELKREHSAQERLFILEERELISGVRELIDQYEKREQLVAQPSAVELEEAVLGAIMLERPALPAVIGFLKPENFFLDAHRLIYSAAIELRENDEVIDMRTVANQLSKSGHIKAVGGAYYVALITSKVSSAANIEYHARVIVEQSTKRSLIKLAQDILHDAFDETVDVFELLDAVENNLVQTVLNTGELAAKRWRKSKIEPITIPND